MGHCEADHTDLNTGHCQVCTLSLLVECYHRLPGALYRQTHIASICWTVSLTWQFEIGVDWVAQVLQLSQRDRAAEWVGQLTVGDWKWGTIFYRHYRSVFNHCDVKLTSQAIEFGEKNPKRLLRRSRSLKVIQVGKNRKPIWDWVINTRPYNWHPISYRFGVIAAYCSNFGHFAFLGHPWGGGIGTTYDVHPELIGKRVVDFLSVLIIHG